MMRSASFDNSGFIDNMVSESLKSTGHLLDESNKHKLLINPQMKEILDKFESQKDQSFAVGSEKDMSLDINMHEIESLLNRDLDENKANSNE